MLFKDEDVVFVEKESHSRVGAAFLSFIIPGLGQMYKGQIFNGIAWFLLVIFSYFFFVFLGIILHLCCVLGAASGKNKETIIRVSPSPKAEKIEEKALSSIFYDKINNSYLLLQRGIITKEEFQKAKERAIEEFPERPWGIQREVFLTLLIPLLDSGALTLPEIEILKEKF